MDQILVDFEFLTTISAYCLLGTQLNSVKCPVLIRRDKRQPNSPNLIVYFLSTCWNHTNVTPQTNQLSNVLQVIVSGAVLALARWGPTGATIPAGGGAQYAAELRILLVYLSESLGRLGQNGEPLRGHIFHGGPRPPWPSVEPSLPPPIAFRTLPIYDSRE